MSKVRVDHEDVFIQNIDTSEAIPEIYHFDFKSNWVSNNSQTKKIAIRKIDVVPMTFAAGQFMVLKRKHKLKEYMKIYCLH
jgi:hypothetical protein